MTKHEDTTTLSGVGSSDVLARCPFCGGEANVSNFFATRHPPTGAQHVAGYVVFCLNCKAAGPKRDTSQVNDPHLAAVEAWNMRANK